jgi:hypothetical protein
MIISQVNSTYPIWTQKLISDVWKGGRRAQAWAHNCDTTRQWQKMQWVLKKEGNMDMMFWSTRVTHELRFAWGG